MNKTAKLIMQICLITLSAFLIIFGLISYILSFYSYVNDDMVHYQVIYEGSISDDITGDYELVCNTASVVTIRPTAGHDDYSAVKTIIITNGTNVETIKFGYGDDANYSSSTIVSDPSTFDDWGTGYSVFYTPFEIAVTAGTTIKINSYVGGSEVTANSDYLVMIMCGLILLGFAIHTFFITELNPIVTEGSIIAGVEAAIIGFYPLGVFFKALFKAVAKKKTFDFAGNVGYMIIGIIGILALATIIACYFLIYKKKKFIFKDAE